MNDVNPSTADWDLSDTEEQLAMQLDSLEPENEATAAPIETTNSSVDEAGVKFVVGGLLAGFEFMVKKVAKNPYLKVPEETGDALAEKLIPVLDKYDVGTPEFLDRWKEELELGMVFAGVCVGLYQQHVEIQKQLIAQAKTQEVTTSDNQGAESEKKAA
ncbi:hypothetical protein [Aliivibrio fischeri]|uniref:hypothetical protein n=1 Tax=Aliivibrio fischeri TaxID=668 RepID=UPI0007C5310D|nr:hypothetical protein [Aliivibrio fischeri]